MYHYVYLISYILGKYVVSRLLLLQYKNLNKFYYCFGWFRTEPERDEKYHSV